MTRAPVRVADLAELPTLSTGQCCDLKREVNGYRYWLCRGNGTISVERLRNGRWRIDVDHQRSVDGA